MWRIRKSIKRKWTIGILFCLLQCVGVGVCYTVVRYTTVRNYTTMLEEKDVRIQQARRTVYLTRAAVKAGEVFSEENTEQRTVLSEQNPEELETVVLGKVACADLPEGSIVTKGVCCASEVLATERECVLRNIRDSECFGDGMMVELRIRYENGESYCVLKKKRLIKKEEEKGLCRLFLTEEEQLLLSAAQYDVQVYDGAELYMAAFREVRVQEEAGCEYPPPLQIALQLCSLNENYEKVSDRIAKQRETLEERLTEYKR